MRSLMRLSAVAGFIFTSGLALSRAQEKPATPPAAPQLSPLDAALAKLKSEDPMTRRLGAEELSRIRDPKSVEALTGALQDKEAVVRAASIDALGVMHAGAARIAELLVKDPSPQVRAQAAISLTYLADPSTEDALVQALEDSEQTVRLSTARTLGNLRSQKAVKRLSEMLVSEDVTTRQAAAAALERIASHESLEPLKKASGDPDPTVRQQAVRGLASIGDKSAIDTLKARLQDAEPQVKVQAAMGLGRLGDASGLPIGLELLASDVPLHRQQGSQIVGMLGDEAGGLKALNAAFEKEQDPGTKQMLDLSRAQLKARLGIREPAPAAPPPAPKTVPASPESPAVEQGKSAAPKKPAKPKKKP